MYAVIRTGGKQYRVAAEDVLKIEKIAGEVGDIVQIDQVLAFGEGENVTIGAPFVDGASVAAVNAALKPIDERSTKAVPVDGTYCTSIGCSAFSIKKPNGNAASEDVKSVVSTTEPFESPTVVVTCGPGSFFDHVPWGLKP